ncbi:MAG: hypothetical protein ABIQ84_02170 [Usitatibacter sp.]
MKPNRPALLSALVYACLVNSAQAAAPDTEAVEFYNVKLNHFFVTANAAEARGIDAGAAGPGWVRTGRSFRAWTRKSAAPPTAKPVCRFYSSGANSHFYTADASECSSLQSLHASQRAAGNASGWGYEGKAFYIQSPTAGACPAGSTALNRVYNNGFTSGEGSNHRFVDDSTLAALMVDGGWVAEGVAMCAQSKATGDNSNLPPTTTHFEAIAATWQGLGRWKAENEDTDTESRVFEPLALTITAGGVVSGEGYGCTFTGLVLRGDGFRSHFSGTISAAGCTDPRFAGDYKFMHLEHFGPDTLIARMKLEAGPVEARIDAVLFTDAATLPPPPGGFAGVEGSWIGTVAWNAEPSSDGDHDDDDDDDEEGDEQDHEVSVNQPLSLQISADGAVTGSGFGCTFTGTLMQADERHDGKFIGTLEAAGCTDPLFNGTYLKVRVHIEDDASLEIEIERETKDGTIEVEVEIEGHLHRVTA